MNFNDIFKSSFLENVTQFSVLDVAIAMLFSVVVGLFIFLIYKKTFAGVMYSTGFAASLVGLCMITTFVILAVTSNVVLSLGMVGALSIVRFRTAIKDPMEIVFLFWSLAAGIVIGAGMVPLAVIGSVLIGIVLLIFSRRKSIEKPYLLVINCLDENAESSAMELLKSAVHKYTIKSKTVSKKGVELSAEIRMKNANTSFINRFCSLEGVENAVLVSYNGEYMS